MVRIPIDSCMIFRLQILSINGVLRNAVRIHYKLGCFGYGRGGSVGGHTCWSGYQDTAPMLLSAPTLWYRSAAT